MQKEFQQGLSNYVDSFLENSKSSILHYIDSLVPQEDKKFIFQVFILAFKKTQDNNNFEYDIRSFIIASRIIRLIYNEFLYIVSNKSREQIEQLKNDETFKERISKLVAFKFSILRKSFEEDVTIGTPIVSFSPINTTLKCLMTKVIQFNLNFSKGNPQVSLIPDLFQKVFSKIYSVTKMLSNSLSVEAYAAWRTIHESECIIKLLVSNSPQIIPTYVRHIVYNNSLRGGITDTNELNENFAEMKAKMKQHNLKSKDMKKFIEYGWIYDTKEFDESDPNYKLNFRDGIQKCANLNRYKDLYEGASEVTHSSPVFFYSNDEACLDISIIAIYESTLRLVEIFKQYYGKELEKNELFKEINRLELDCKNILDKQRNLHQDLYTIFNSTEESELKTLFKTNYEEGK